MNLPERLRDARTVLGEVFHQEAVATTILEAADEIERLTLALKKIASGYMEFGEPKQTALTALGRDADLQSPPWRAALATCEQINRDLTELGLVSEPADDGIPLRDHVRKLMEELCAFRDIHDPNRDAVG